VSGEIASESISETQGTSVEIETTNENDVDTGFEN